METYKAKLVVRVEGNATVYSYNVEFPASGISAALVRALYYAERYRDTVSEWHDKKPCSFEVISLSQC